MFLILPYCIPYDYVSSVLPYQDSIMSVLCIHENAKYKKMPKIKSTTTFAAAVLNVIYEELWKVLQFKTTKFHLHQFEMVLKAARVPLGPPKAPNVFELREN